MKFIKVLNEEDLSVIKLPELNKYLTIQNDKKRFHAIISNYDKDWGYSALDFDSNEFPGEKYLPRLAKYFKRKIKKRYYDWYICSVHISWLFSPFLNENPDGYCFLADEWSYSKVKPYGYNEFYDGILFSDFIIKYFNVKDLLFEVEDFFTYFIRRDGRLYPEHWRLAEALKSPGFIKIFGKKPLDDIFEEIEPYLK